MQEVEGLTVAAIDWIVEKIEDVRGLIGKEYWNKNLCLGCALGTLGWGHRSDDELGLLHDPNHRWKSKWLEFGIGFECLDGTVMRKECLYELELVNEAFPVDATPEERKAHVLSWLRDQRALKCSDWTVPIKEVVPDRKAVLA